jgi:hypothetical protein
MQAIFPDCAEFSGEKCYANFQKGDIGVCFNSGTKKYERLVCAKKYIGYTWQPSTSLDLVITKYTNKTLNKVTLGFEGLTTSDVTVLYLSDESIEFNSVIAKSLLLPQIPLPRLKQLTELAKIYA